MPARGPRWSTSTRRETVTGRSRTRWASSRRRSWSAGSDAPGGTSRSHPRRVLMADRARSGHASTRPDWGDRKSTRLNSSHITISYAVFCLKKKKKKKITTNKKKKKTKKIQKEKN